MNLSLVTKLIEWFGWNTGGGWDRTYMRNTSRNPGNCTASHQCVSVDVCSESFSGKNFCRSLDSCMASLLSAHADAISNMFSGQMAYRKRSN